MNRKTRLIRNSIGLAACIGLLGAAPAWALKVEPGQWETDFTFTVPFMAEPQTRTDSQCIEETEFDMEDLLNDPDNPCQMTIVENSDSVLKMEMNCPTPQGQVTGFWNVRSDGDTMQGEGGTTMSMGGQEFTTTMTMRGRRTGDCE
jgi:hypothetical protein